MSGHSRWAGIKHKKAAVDAKKGKVFTRLNREIMIAAKNGGGKPENNPRLRKAIEMAKAANMPNDNVKRAIQKGTGELPGVSFEDVVYEGYGPGGVALYVEGTTDNRNRTTSEIRHLFDSHGGNLGESGSVAFMFDVKGLVRVPREGLSEEKIMEVALEAGAEDIKTEDESAFEVYTDPLTVDEVKEKIEKAGLPVESAEVSRIPKNSVHLDGDDAENCLKLLNALEEHEDVKGTSANFDIDQDVIDKFSGGE